MGRYFLAIICQRRRQYQYTWAGRFLWHTISASQQLLHWKALSLSPFSPLVKMLISASTAARQRLLVHLIRYTFHISGMHDFGNGESLFGNNTSQRGRQGSKNFIRQLIARYRYRIIIAIIKPDTRCWGKRRDIERWWARYFIFLLFLCIYDIFALDKILSGALIIACSNFLPS